MVEFVCKLKGFLQLKNAKYLFIYFMFYLPIACY